MASELQAKLNEKQTKCEEIEFQFKELKRSVAKNAVFSRTNKPLPVRMINDWETTDEAKDSEVHQYRLQNIQLRNSLQNCEKILRKKEQLADGLHLIDFEQLKIENQTLNEKIEERNEELGKLSYKIRTAVIIVSHTREKLQYVRKQNEQRKQTLDHLENDLDNVQNELRKIRQDRDDQQNGPDGLNALRQKSAILSNDKMSEDQKKRLEEKKGLEDRVRYLQAAHRELTETIRAANQYKQSSGY